MEAPLLEKNMKKHKKKKIFKLIFLMGFLVALYPLVTRLYYRTKVVEQVKDFDEAKAKLDKEEVDKRMRLARGYNEAHRNPSLRATAEIHHDSLKARLLYIQRPDTHTHKIGRASCRERVSSPV